MDYSWNGKKLFQRYLYTGGVNYNAFENQLITLDKEFIKCSWKKICNLLQSNECSSQEIVSLVVDAYNQGSFFSKNIALITLAACCSTNDAPLAKEARTCLNHVCVEPRNILEFSEIYATLNELNNSKPEPTSGWGRAHRRAIQNWYSQKRSYDTAFAVTSCSALNHWSHKDMLKLCHLKQAKSSSLEVICTYIVKGYKATKLRYSNHDVTAKDCDNDDVTGGKYEDASMDTDDGDGNKSIVKPDVISVKLGDETEYAIVENSVADSMNIAIESEQSSAEEVAVLQIDIGNIKTFAVKPDEDNVGSSNSNNIASKSSVSDHDDVNTDEVDMKNSDENTEDTAAMTTSEVDEQMKCDEGSFADDGAAIFAADTLQSGDHGTENLVMEDDINNLQISNTENHQPFQSRLHNEKTTSHINNNLEDEKSKLLEFLDAIDKLKHTKSAEDVTDLFAKYKLTWDHLPCSWHNDSKLWKKLILLISLKQLINNLPRLHAIHLMEDDSLWSKFILQRLMDEEDIKNSHLHPFEFFFFYAQYAKGKCNKKKYVTYEEQATILCSPKVVRTDTKTNKWQPDLQILSALNAGFYMSLTNMEPIEQRLNVTVEIGMPGDVSCGGCSLSRTSVAAALCFVLQRKCDKFALKTFSNRPKDKQMQNRLRSVDIRRCDTIEAVESEINQIKAGKVDYAMPMIYEKKSDKIKVDTFIEIISGDNQQTGKTTFLKALKEYRKRVNPRTKLVLIELRKTMRNRETPGDNEDDLGVLRILGFDYTVPLLIHNFISDKF